VAVDGSESSLAALDWALDEALRRRRPLRIVTAWLLPPPAYAPVVTQQEGMRAWGRSVLDAAVATAREKAPGLPVEGVLEQGPAARVVLDQSEKSVLVVVGCRGRGGFSSMLLGSTSDAIARHAKVPVVVVRGTLSPRGQVVVGVDGSAASEAAVEFSFEMASSVGVPLVAVHAWNAIDPFATDVLVQGGEVALRDLESKLVLSETLAGWREKFPDVVVREVTADGHPVTALLNAAEGARLLVVGDRGRGGFVELVLGSVGRGVLHHATCPVAVVRGAPDR
jgi:nucleotide-binding universal stress UspA family protein